MKPISKPHKIHFGATAQPPFPFLDVTFLRLGSAKSSSSSCHAASLAWAKGPTAQVVVVPQHCMPLWWFENYHPTLFVHHLGIVIKATFQSFVNDRVALEAMLEFAIGFLRLSNLLCGKREDILFFTPVCKQVVHITFLHLCSSVVLIVTLP
jgi:hypothetical protein